MTCSRGSISPLRAPRLLLRWHRRFPGSCRGRKRRPGELEGAHRLAPLAQQGKRLSPAALLFRRRHRQSSWCAMAVDAVSTGTTGATNRAIGSGAIVFRTGAPTTPGAQVGTIPTQIDTAPLGRLVILSKRHTRELPAARTPECQVGRSRHCGILVCVSRFTLVSDPAGA